MNELATREVAQLLDNPGLRLAPHDRRRYVILPRTVQARPDLHPGAKIVWCALLSAVDYHEDGPVIAHASVATIMARTGLPERTVQRHLKELARKRLLRRIMAGGKPLAKFELLPIPEGARVAPRTSVQGAKSAGGGANLAPSGCQNGTHHNTRTPNTRTPTPHTASKAQLNGTSKPPADSPAVLSVSATLVDAGISPKVAKRLARRYPQERIERQLDGLRTAQRLGEVNNPPGWLRRAIEEDWPPPGKDHPPAHVREQLPPQVNGHDPAPGTNGIMSLGDIVRKALTPPPQEGKHG